VLFIYHACTRSFIQIAAQSLPGLRSTTPLVDSAISRLVHRTPRASPHPGAPSGNGPIPNFWTPPPPWASRSLTVRLLFFMSHPLFFPFFPIVSLSPCLSTILYYTFDSRTSFPNGRVTSSVHKPALDHLVQQPFLQSKRDALYPSRARPLSSVSPLFSWTTCLTLLTLIVTLPGASSTIACK
jgi:hypothetical protein